MVAKLRDESSADCQFLERGYFARQKSEAAKGIVAEIIRSPSQRHNLVAPSALRHHELIEVSPAWHDSGSFATTGQVWRFVTDCASYADNSE
jgi:hypothetical protein